MHPSELTITLGGPSGRLSVSALQTALENALVMLRNVEASLTSMGTVVEWEVVRVQMRSPLKVTVTPRIRAKSSKRLQNRIVKACLDGVGKIEKSNKPPEHFNEDALLAAKELVTRATKEGATVSFSKNGKDKITLTDKTVKRVDELVEKARKYRDVSTLEGVLQVISTHGRQSFFIYEQLTNQRIECLVGDVSAFTDMLDKRVSVTGHVKYVNHVPKQIEVADARDVRVLATEVVNPSDIGPIIFNDELSSEDHVRSMRDA